MANIYYHIEKYDLAIPHFLYVVKQVNNDFGHTASLYNNVALAYQHLNNSVQAEKYFKLALKNWKVAYSHEGENGVHKYFEKVIQNNIYSLRLDSTITDQFILNNYLELIAFGETNNEYIGMSSYINLCKDAYLCNRPDIAEKYYDYIKNKWSVLDINKSSDLEVNELIFIKELYEVSNNSSLIKKFTNLAQEQNNEYGRKLKIYTSNFNLDKEWSIKMLTNQELILQNEKKLKNNLLYSLISVFVLTIILGISFLSQRRIKRKVKEKNKQIELSLVNKEMLLKEIYHRVKNNLQLVSSIAYLEYEKNGEKFDFFSFENRIISLSLIHQSLYSTENISTISFDVYIKELLRNLQKTNLESFTYSLEIDPIHLCLDNSITLGLLINELVTNTNKHCVPPEGEVKHIQIMFNVLGNNKLFKYSDNGTQFDHPKPKSGSFGSSLIELLIYKLRGRFQTDFKTGYLMSIKFGDTLK